MRHIWFAALAGFVFATTDALAQDMYVRVVDVDDSLCVVTRSPEGQVMLFDAGDSGRYCRRALEEMAPERRIGLLVVSRLDRHNVGELAAILDDYAIAQVLHPGLDQDNRGMMRGLWRRLQAQGVRSWSVAATPLGQTFALGSAR